MTEDDFIRSVARTITVIYGVIGLIAIAATVVLGIWDTLAWATNAGWKTTHFYGLIYTVTAAVFFYGGFWLVSEESQNWFLDGGRARRNMMDGATKVSLFFEKLGAVIGLTVMVGFLAVLVWVALHPAVGS